MQKSNSLFFYSLPMAAGGLINMLMGNYLMKYGTDILLVAPATMGLIFFISRIWDAVNDPIIGFLSDKTSSPMGRRLSWIAGSALPLALSFYFLWNPPIMSDTLLPWWLGFFTILVFTSLTGLYVPHYALGADLASSYEKKNQIFGTRAILENIGTFAGVFMILYLTQNEKSPQSIQTVMILISLFAIAMIVLLILKIQEPKNDFFLTKNINTAQDKSSANSGHQKNTFVNTLRGISTNGPALIVLATGFFSQLGAAVLLALVLYHSQYIMNDKQLGPLIIGIFLLFATLFIPLWIFLGKYIEKKILWRTGLIILSIGFAMTFFIGPNDKNILFIISAVLGAFAGISLIVHPSMLADTIHFAQWRTGTKQEGAYFSIFTFVNKSSMALANVAVGLTLQWSGFLPNIAQSLTTQNWIKFGYAFFPATAFALGALLLSFYPLNKRKNERILRFIDERGR